MSSRSQAHRLVPVVLALTLVACEAESVPTTSLPVVPDQAELLAIDAEEFRDCVDGYFARRTPHTQLPDWAHDARSIAGRWIVAGDDAVALATANIEQNRFVTVTWHFAEPPDSISEFSTEATSPSGQRVEASDLGSTRGFYKSTFEFNEEGCWEIEVSWGSHQRVIGVYFPLSFQ